MHHILFIQRDVDKRRDEPLVASVNKRRFRLPCHGRMWIFAAGNKSKSSAHPIPSLDVHGLKHFANLLEKWCHQR